MTTDKACDNASAGVLIEQAGRWLFIWRNTFPLCVAPVAGHVFDDHACYEDAARAEVREETGLSVESLHLTGAGGWRPNACRRYTPPSGVRRGHLWQVFTATVSGELSPSEREVKQARWLSRPQVQLLANRTMLLARGTLSEGEWRDYPGIEPVWVGFLADLDVISMPVADLELVARLAEDS